MMLFFARAVNDFTNYLFISVNLIITLVLRLMLVMLLFYDAIDAYLAKCVTFDGEM